MRIFTIIAVDEFKRQYGYTHICMEREFEFNEDWIYEYWFQHMVRDILRRMGEDAKATWICEYDVREGGAWLLTEPETTDSERM